MSEQMIDGMSYDMLKLSDLYKFDTYYVVPKYQRGYAWTDEEIGSLLTDLEEAWHRFPEEAYLLGSIIVCDSQPINKNQKLHADVNQYDLIDGQQRVTTLFIMIQVIISEIKANAAENEEALDPAAAKRLSTFENPLTLLGQDSEIFPQVRPATDGQTVLQSLINDERLPTDFTSPTQENLVDAITQIREWTNNQTLSEQLSFLNFLMSRVFVVRIGLKTFEHATRVFQKINNRGLTLDDADLIKSYLFQYVDSDEDYESIAQHWQSATQKLMAANKKSLRMMETLMKLLIGIKTGTYVAKNDLYETWSDILKENPREIMLLSASLVGSASDLVAISKGVRPQDMHRTEKTLGALQSGYIQPLEVLLGGSHLSVKSYDMLLSLVEDRAMLSSWSREKTQDFEPIMHPWAHAVHNLDSHVIREELLEASSSAFKNFEDLQRRAFLGISNLSYLTNSHQKRIRYIIARAHQAMHKKFGLIDHGMSSLMKTSNPTTKERGFDLDHVFPKSESKREFWRQDHLKDDEFGSQSRYESSVHSVGNLILLHPDDNRDQRDELPWSETKLSNLSTSQLVINQALVPDEFRPLGNSSMDNAIRHARDHGLPQITEDGWGEEQADQMAKFYWRLISEEIRQNFGLSLN